MHFVPKFEGAVAPSVSRYALKLVGASLLPVESHQSGEAPPDVIQTEIILAFHCFIRNARLHASAVGKLDRLQALDMVPFIHFGNIHCTVCSDVVCSVAGYRVCERGCGDDCG